MSAPPAEPYPVLERIARWLLLAALAVGLVCVPVVFSPQLYDDFTLAKQVALLVSAAAGFLALALLGFPVHLSKPVRIALAFWVVCLMLSQMFAADGRSGLLGVYQYRQGFLTQVCYVVLFVCAALASGLGYRRTLALMPAFGLAGVFLYTAIQSAGRDPFEWWLDTSDRAIGTIGNANELAAYAVVALASSGAVLATTWRARYAVAGAVVAASLFCVLEGESRSGLAAIVVFVLLLPATWLLASNSLRTLVRPAMAVGAGLIAGAVLSFAAGGISGSSGRIQSGAAGADAGGSTRISLWRGTLEVIKFDPLTGVGPDGLALAFPIHRPADLGGAYDQYDLVAQSSHNYVLDVAANAGIPGVLSFSALVALCAWNAISIRRRSEETRSPFEPFTWAALAAYGALTLLNPISLAAHTTFFVLLGSMAADPVQHALVQPARMRIAIRLFAAAPALAFAAYIAIRLPWADLEANRAWEDHDAQRFGAAAEHYKRANELMPFEGRYLRGEAESRLAFAATTPAPSALLDASAVYVDLERDFELMAGDVLSIAAIEIALGGDSAEVDPIVERALSLNPHGISMADYTARLRTAAAQGNGVLRYSQQDHWSYIELGARP